MLQQVPRLTYEVAQGKRIFQEHRSCSAVVKCTSFPWQEPCWGSVCPCPPCQPWSRAPSPRGVSTVPRPWEGRWCPGTPWHCPAEPVVLRGWGWSGSRAAGAACPVLLLCAQSHAGEIWVCTLTPQCPCPVLPLLSHSVCAPVPAGFGCIPGAVPGVILLGPPSPCCCHHSPCGTKHKVGASISRSPAPASSPVDDLVLKAWALALGEGSRDKIISASS